jgi:rhodanese-related sulfurtransferase
MPLGSLLDQLRHIPRDHELLLICRSGNRSGMAQRQLLELGYERVSNVAGGMRTPRPLPGSQ